MSANIYQCQLQSSAQQLTTLSELLWGMPGILAVEECETPEQAMAGTAETFVPERLTLWLESPEHQIYIATWLENLGLHPGKQWHWVRQATPVLEQDWAEHWKQYWRPTPITPTLTIVPSWEVYHPQHANEQLLVLDPGAAFGTGSHETTRLMLRQLSHYQAQLSQCRLLDVGTGSGILGIAAALWGCCDVVGIDIDAMALDAAQANAEKNKVAHVCHFSTTGLAALCHTPCDLILANIVGPVLVQLMPELALRLAKPHGRLLLSGLIEHALPSVIDALQSAGLHVTQTQQDGAWFLLEATYG